ncbi:MAG: hypothetical protein HJJLKODD_02345 [Phycisphaerae bacterium]|nr:hypothetical protein [Phycisphaerae bacterium]
MSRNVKLIGGGLLGSFISGMLFSSEMVGFLQPSLLPIWVVCCYMATELQLRWIYVMLAGLCIALMGGMAISLRLTLLMGAPRDAFMMVLPIMVALAAVPGMMLMLLAQCVRYINAVICRNQH